MDYDKLLNVSVELEALARALAASVKGEEPAPAPEETEKPRGFVCKICGFIYESDTLPEDYVCPICRRPAADFEPVQCYGGVCQ